MLFRKKKKQTELITPEQNAETVETLDDNKDIKTTLSFHEDWHVEPQERYVYQFQHTGLPLLKKNQISISGIDLLPYNDGFIVVAFLRNTLSKAVRFETVHLLLLNEEDQVFAKKEFDLEDLGELPSNSARPWRFLFDVEDTIADINYEGEWKIAFELSQKPKHSLELEESWENQTSIEQKEQLEKLVSSLPPLSNTEFNIMGLEAKLMENRDLQVTILLRNGSQTTLNIEQLPLIVEDASGDIVCRGSFQLGTFEVKANTSKPWTFIFPQSLLLKENIDLSSWKVSFPKESS